MSLAWPAHSLPSNTGDPRLVLVVLRGGLDGLGEVPAHGDPDYRRARGGLADPIPGAEDGILNLDGFFGLHGRLEHMHELFSRGDLAVVHAVAPPYHERSHFDGQDVLETGFADPSSSADGWLFRALALLPGRRDPAQHAMAVGGPVPLVLRGAIPVSSWAPDRLPQPDGDTVRRLRALYAEDPLLGPRLEAGLATGQMLGVDADGNGFPPRGRGSGLGVSVKAAAGFLTHADGPRIAVLEEGGWDTHANQQGQLSNRLGGLDEALRNLEAELGAAWSQTVVMIVTEFGRTVAMNGTRGSDHGVGGVAFAAGGAVAGGRVLGDWPGLGRRDLYQGRDLMPTTDVRALFRSVLVSHLGLDEKAVDERVFPDARLPSFGGLLRS
jgi:uncharacterized protein (DUF1501 family)